MRNSKRIKEYQQQVMASYATSESCFVNTIQGVEAIKSSQGEQVHTERVAQAYGAYQEKSYDLGLFSNKLGLIFQTAATIILVAVVSLGTFGVLDKWLTVGELMAALSLSSTVVGGSLPFTSYRSVSGGERCLYPFARFHTRRKRRSSK